LLYSLRVKYTKIVQWSIYKNAVRAVPRTISLGFSFFRSESNLTKGGTTNHAKGEFYLNFDFAVCGADGAAALGLESKFEFVNFPSIYILHVNLAQQRAFAAALGEIEAEVSVLGF